MSQGAIQVEISPGELVDRLTILEIKAARFPPGAKRQRVESELQRLSVARDAAWGAHGSPELSRLASALQAINESLWEVEDQLRTCERDQDFGPRFIQLARSVYQQNDRRADLKDQINRLLGSRLREVKSYETYGVQGGDRFAD